VLHKFAVARGEAPTLDIRSSAAASAPRGAELLQSWCWHDASWFAFHATSQIVVLDATDGHIEPLIDAPCPALHLARRHEAGHPDPASLVTAGRRRATIS